MKWLNRMSDRTFTTCVVVFVMFLFVLGPVILGWFAYMLTGITEIGFVVGVAGFLAAITWIMRNDDMDNIR